MKNFDLTQLTNEELSDLQNLIYFERQNRAKERQKKLIDTFKRAWNDIEEAGFTIHVKDADSFYDGDVIYFDDIEIY